MKNTIGKILFCIFIAASALFIAIRSSAQVHLDSRKLLSYVNVTAGKRLYMDNIDINHDTSRINWSVSRNDTVLAQGYFPTKYQFYNAPEAVWKASTLRAFKDIAAFLKLEILE